MSGRNELDRRDFLRLTGIAGAGAVMVACGAAPEGGGDAAAPAAGEAASDEAAAPAAADGEVPREKMLIVMNGGNGTQYTDAGLGNPYATGASHSMGSAALWEPLFFWSAFADEEVPWLATDYEYNDDFTELTVNLREGVEWSDGEAFDANDVVFTLNMLKENAPALSYSTAVDNAVATAEAVDDLTVHITFNEPRPRFMFNHLMSKFDRGLKWVPEHIFKDVEDVASFEYFDPEKGWPLATGPYTIVEWTPMQKIINRRDDWWGVKTGFMDRLPAPERLLWIPRTTDDTALIQRIVNDEVDQTLDLRASTIAETFQNPNITTHTGTEPPYGYMDWWPTSIWFNHEDGPFTEKDVRWAVSYSIDRQQLLDVGLGGSGIVTPLPFPQYPAMNPYFEATQELLAKYPTNEFNLEKAAALMEGQGYEKDGEGFWVKDGERVPAVLSGWQVFNDIGPLIAEQLRKAGFEAEYTTPADHGTRMSDGTSKIWINGHGGTIADPFTTLDFYTSKYWAPIGEPTQYQSRFQNAEYDELLAQMATMPADDPAYMDLYLAAMEIWLENLVEAPVQQWLHRIPMNTTYWEGWPTEENPYLNGATWHMTLPLMLHNLEPAQ